MPLSRQIQATPDAARVSPPGRAGRPDASRRGNTPALPPFQGKTLETAAYLDRDGVQAHPGMRPAISLVFCHALAVLEAHQAVTRGLPLAGTFDAV